MPKFNSITIGELKGLLDDYDYEDETLVCFSSDYGDHCHTEQAHTITGVIEEVKLAESAYSDSGFKVLEDDADDNDGLQKVLVLK